LSLSIAEKIGAANRARKEICKLSEGWRISERDITKEKKLGGGAYGSVYRGVLRGSIAVAIKEMHGNDQQGSSGQRKTENIFSDAEVRFLQRCRNMYLVMFIGCGSYCNDGSLFLVLELCESGALDTYLQAKRPEWPQRIHFLIDVAEGLCYLHLRHKALHRDIKGPNILLTARSEGHARCKVKLMAKIADFGISTISRGKRTYFADNSDDQILLSHKSLTEDNSQWVKTFQDTFVGTLQWMAPELLEQRLVYGPPVDVFSYAVVIWEVIACLPPWQSNPELLRDQSAFIAAVVAGRRPLVTRAMREEAPPGLVALMEESWDTDPKKRPSTRSLVDRLYKIVDDVTAVAVQESLVQTPLVGDGNEADCVGVSITLKRPEHRGGIKNAMLDKLTKSSIEMASV